jgi:ubiquinone/menaquinone biosynthesis C-methylase UbiE
MGGPARMSVLDVGCGTGLGSELLLGSGLGPRIRDITLLDPSREMLDNCDKRASRWGASYKLVQGTIESVSGSFDLLLSCSVLHHIPDLTDFLQRVDRIVPSGGWFLHFQDPNGDHFTDPALHQRLAEIRLVGRDRIPGWARRLAPSRVFRRLWREFTRRPNVPPRHYIDEVNEALLHSKVIAAPLSSEEIWSVTDLHVAGLPFSIGDGISLQWMRGILSDWKLVSARSYAFYGRMLSELPPRYQRREREFAAGRQMNGREFCAAWQRN